MGVWTNHPHGHVGPVPLQTSVVMAVPLLTRGRYTYNTLICDTVLYDEPSSQAFRLEFMPEDKDVRVHLLFLCSVSGWGSTAILCYTHVFLLFPFF